MKLFEKPIVEVQEFAVEDVITASAPAGEENETGRA